MFYIFLVVNVEKYCTMAFFRNYSMEHMANLLNILPEANKLVSSAVSNPVVSSAKPDMFLHEVHPAPLISTMTGWWFQLARRIWFISHRIHV